MAEIINFENTERVLREYAAAAEDLFKDNLLRDGRVATGYLIDSIRTEVVIHNTTLAVDMHLADYWKYVEYDTKPHLAPVGPLFEWVKAKPLLPHNEGRIRTRGKKKGIPYTREELQLGIAYAIRHKIKEHGTKGKHTLEATSKALNETYMTLIADAVALDFGAQADIILRTFAK